jgi:hypothetical protein
LSKWTFGLRIFGLTQCLPKVEIIPAIHAYPTYSHDPFYPLEYYYEIDDYPLNESGKSIINEVEISFAEHLRKFGLIGNMINQQAVKLKTVEAPAKHLAGSGC